VTDPVPPEDDWNDDSDADLIICPQCAHPNLAFRTHCRKCGGRLVGAANLIPGAELVEWSPTDGPASARRAVAPLRVLVMLAGVMGFVLTSYGLQAGSTALLVMGIAPLILAGIIYSRIRTIEAHTSESDETVPEGDAVCPECGSPVLDYDDICPACGALTAENPNVATHDDETG